ncbi:MAG: DUF2809 domain-containing protein [Lachnospiraceae bacterium]|nr:DUF2809 domain-containing protein [Lachnospiraceae bacterium]
MDVRKKRQGYFVTTVLLFGVEVLIALFVHDTFVRPYVGDVLVVMVIYAFVRIFVPEKMRLLPLYVFLFASCVEGLQAVHIVERLGLSGNRFFSVLIGATFDFKDIICYAVGCVLLGGYEILNRKMTEREERHHGIL